MLSSRQEKVWEAARRDILDTFAKQLEYAGYKPAFKYRREGRFRYGDTVSLLDDALSNGVQNDLRDAMQIEFGHQVSAVCIDGMWTEMQQRCDFLGGF